MVGVLIPLIVVIVCVGVIYWRCVQRKRLAGGQQHVAVGHVTAPPQQVTIHHPPPPPQPGYGPPPQPGYAPPPQAGYAPPPQPGYGPPPQPGYAPPPYSQVAGAPYPQQGKLIKTVYPGLEIVTDWSPVQPKIPYWRPVFESRMPVGDLRYRISFLLNAYDRLRMRVGRRRKSESHTAVKPNTLPRYCKMFH